MGCLVVVICCLDLVVGFCGMGLVLVYLWGLVVVLWWFVIACCGLADYLLFVHLLLSLFADRVVGCFGL